MTTELEKFQMRRRRRDEPDDRARQAAEVGALTTGSLAARHGILHGALDASEEAAMPRSTRYDDFLGKLKPGDVIFHRKQHKDTGKAEFAGVEAPFRELDVMLAAKGDPFYHASVYRGRGKTTEAAGWDEGVKNSRLWGAAPEELRAYRPNVSETQRQRALDFVRSKIGAKYKGELGVMRHGAEHLLSPLEGPSTGQRGSKGLTDAVCTELAAEAYPSLFGKRFMSPADMRHHPSMEMVGHYGHIPAVGARERILTRGVYPLLRNLKWGVLGGLGAYGAMSLSDHFRKHATKGPSDGIPG